MPSSDTTQCRRIKTLLIGSLLAAAHLLAAAQGNYQQQHTGQGTFYGYGGGGNCSFPKPAGILTAAMNTADYNTAQACGACIEVTNLNTQQSTVVRVDDRCPECAPGDVDLSQEAFAKISPLGAGRIPISWKYVSCTPPSAKLYFKEGSSPWWAGVQVRDHRGPVASLGYRASGSGGAFTSLGREMYNYFIAPSGMGAGPYDIQVTDVFGQQVTATGVALAVTTEIDLGLQFPQVLPSPGSSSGGGGSTGGTVPATTAIGVDNDWGQGYCSTVTVTNPNATPLTWMVSFPVVGTTYTSWNATVSQSGATVTASGVSWNQVLQAQASTSFGFCANR